MNLGYRVSTSWSRSQGESTQVHTIVLLRGTRSLERRHNQRQSKVIIKEVGRYRQSRDDHSLEVVYRRCFWRREHSGPTVRLQTVPGASPTFHMTLKIVIPHKQIRSSQSNPSNSRCRSRAHAHSERPPAIRDIPSLRGLVLVFPLEKSFSSF